MSQEQLEKFRARGLVTSYAPGAVIFSEGEVHTTIFLIVRGRLTLLRGEVPTTEAWEGECVGEEDVLLGKPMRYTARVAGLCEILPMSEQMFVMLLQNKTIGIQILKQNALRMQAQAEAFATRTHTVTNLREQLNEQARIHEEDMRFINIDLGNLRSDVAAKKARIAALEEQLRKATADKVEDDRLIENLQNSLLKDVKVFGPPVERLPAPQEPLALELEFAEDLALLAPPPLSSPLSIAKISLTQIAVLRPSSPVFTEEGPTEEMPAVPDVVVLQPLQSAPAKRRRDETRSYATRPKETPPARLANEVDDLLAEMRASTPDDKAPKG